MLGKESAACIVELTDLIVIIDFASIWPGHFTNDLRITSVHVHASNDEVMRAQDRHLHLIALVVLGQIDVGPVLLMERKELAIELGVGLLVVGNNIQTFVTLAVVGSHWWVVGHLFGQE